MRALWKVPFLLLTPALGVAVYGAMYEAVFTMMDGASYVVADDGNWDVMEVTCNVVLAVVMALVGLMIGRWRRASLPPWVAVPLLGVGVAGVLVPLVSDGSYRGEPSWPVLVGAAVWVVVLASAAFGAARLSERLAGALVLVGGLSAYYLGVASNMALHPDLNLGPEYSAARFPLAILTSTPFAGDGIGAGLVIQVSGLLPQLLLAASAFAVTYLAVSERAVERVGVPAIA
ncbi:hypothetical protein Lfu02_42410 [Longispora fulva]|uniref:Uncharacterized protein n=1 Tax=Longispora fulva TaxID=619741 RepID=A0A8J7GGE4_9ACTN|nr:hypothetical protein [Longispora fulva]MBG6136700.1 hypothetical protein [Longispora fulva]GIG59869.1 hypothetical protein Lfu02_42410 [Longispora fulva]